MRRFFFACAFAATTMMCAACASPATGPSSVGGVTDISGAWSGTLASSNNPTVQVGVSVSQTGSTITGTWSSSSVNWNGQMTGTMNGSSLSGQLTFTGTTASNSVCTGTANLSGAVNGASLSLTSATGVTGPTCPAPLPIGIQIDLHR